MNQLKQVAEIKNIKGNEKMLLNFAGFENIYQAKKESHLNAPAIYAYLFKEVNDKIKKENEIKVNEIKKQAKITAIKRFHAEIEKIKKETHIKEEVKRTKIEVKITKIKRYKKELRLKQSKNNFTTKSIKN